MWPHTSYIINWILYSFSISFKLYINNWSGAIVSFRNWLKYYISAIFLVFFVLLNLSFIVHRKPWTVLINVWFSYVCSTAVARFLWRTMQSHSIQCFISFSFLFGFFFKFYSEFFSNFAICDAIAFADDYVLLLMLQ